MPKCGHACSQAFACLAWGTHSLTGLLCPQPQAHLPQSVQVVHAVLQQLFKVAADLHKQRAELLGRVAELEAAVERLALEHEQEVVGWERRLVEQQMEKDREWGMQLVGAVAAAEATWTLRLKETESELRGELGQASQASGLVMCVYSGPGGGGGGGGSWGGGGGWWGGRSGWE